MIGLIGIKKEVPIEVREKLIVKEDERDRIIKKLNSVFEEAIILNTCNRTEIYFNHSLDKEDAVKLIFDIMLWDLDLIKYTFYLEGDKVSKHLFEVSSGFHSKILGEDQILGQVKDCYKKAIKCAKVKGEVSKLFELAISCGKKFKSESKLYKIPVSLSSITAKSIAQSGAKNVVIVGFGSVSKLLIKYLLDTEVKRITVIIRNKNKIPKMINPKISFKMLDNLKAEIAIADAVVSCTSSTGFVIDKRHISTNRKLIIYDLAMPRDVCEDVLSLKNVSLYNLDYLSRINDNNLKLRFEKMNEFRYIIEEFIQKYNDYQSMLLITPFIKEMKKHGDLIYKKRLKSYKNKTGRDDNLAEVLLKSTSDAYVNRAIDLLKEEKLKGEEEQCLKILKKIFF